MEESRKKKIAELQDRIFVLQVEERRFCAVLTSQRKDEELKAQAQKGLKETREKLGALTKELVSLVSESKA